MATRRVRLAQRRRSAGLSQERLAELLGVERSTVVRWEAAETEPQPWMRPRLAGALQIDRAELEALLDAVEMSPGEHEKDRITHALTHPSHIDAGAVGGLRERLLALDQRYDHVPSATLIGPAGQLHAQVGHLRANAGSTRRQSELVRVEALSSVLMAQLVWDLSQRRDRSSAVTFLDQAAETAQVVGDVHTSAYAVLRKSYLWLYGERDPNVGVGLAQVAADMARLESPSLSGLALLHVAEGSAMVGDLGSCEVVLHRAELLLERDGRDDAAAEFFNRSEFNRLAGSCYLSLDMPERAEFALRSAAHGLGDREKSYAIVLGNLALALIGQGRADEGADVLHQAVDAVELTRGGGGLNVAFSAGKALRRWRREPWVHDVNDRLLSLMAMS